jgi:hypothetical protein
MKLLTIILALIPLYSYGLSCDTIENNSLTICNDYGNSGDVEKLKKLCLLPNTMGGGQYSKAVFNTTDCSKKKVTAKCEVKSKDVVTYYYKGIDFSRDELQKGCSFFKGAVFTNYTAKNTTSKKSAANANDVMNNPKFKKYMECSKTAKSAEDVKKCTKLLQLN